MTKIKSPIPWTFRLGTQDALMMREVWDEDCYQLPASFTRGDVILDIGAHIGTFAYACLVRGAGRVICVEPEPDNVDLLNGNLFPFSPRFEICPWALGDGRLGRLLSLGKYTAMHHLTGKRSKRGLEVKTFTLDNMLAPHKRIRLLKLDCEGGEWNGIYTSATIFEVVEELVVELHHNLDHLKHGGSDCTTAGMKRHLEQAFDVTVVPGKLPKVNTLLFAKRREKVRVKRKAAAK